MQPVTLTAVATAIATIVLTSYFEASREKILVATAIATIKIFHSC
ncbi:MULTISPECIES: hypothetical protein [unclassified Nostoc]|nr:hypothetical protein [Nostoc sp. DedQUE02]